MPPGTYPVPGWQVIHFDIQIRKSNQALCRVKDTASFFMSSYLPSPRPSAGPCQRIGSQSRTQLRYVTSRGSSSLDPYYQQRQLGALTAYLSLSRLISCVSLPNVENWCFSKIITYNIILTVPPYLRSHSPAMSTFMGSLSNEMVEKHVPSSSF